MCKAVSSINLNYAECVQSGAFHRSIPGLPVPTHFTFSEPFVVTRYETLDHSTFQAIIPQSHNLLVASQLSFLWLLSSFQDRTLAGETGRTLS